MSVVGSSDVDATSCRAATRWLARIWTGLLAWQVRRADRAIRKHSRRPG